MNFFELKGHEIVDITVEDYDLVRIKTLHEGKPRHFRLLHIQDCCENVRLVHEEGDLDSLKGQIITEAEEDISDNDPDWYAGYCDDSHTWSKYNLKTDKDEVTLWFLGESNGYYCEVMTFEELNRSAYDL